MLNVHLDPLTSETIVLVLIYHLTMLLFWPVRIPSKGYAYIPFDPRGTTYAVCLLRCYSYLFDLYKKGFRVVRDDESIKLYLLYQQQNTQSCFNTEASVILYASDDRCPSIYSENSDHYWVLYLLRCFAGQLSHLHVLHVSLFCFSITFILKMKNIRLQKVKRRFPLRS